MSDSQISFDPQAKIVLAKRPLAYDHDYQPFESSAYDLSNTLSSLESVKAQRDYYQGLISKVRDFLFDTAAAEGELSTELSEVAEILDIELTKTVTVTFAVTEVSFDILVPIGTSADEITEDSFRINIEYTGDYDVESAEEGYIWDFSAEDND